MVGRCGEFRIRLSSQIHFDPCNWSIGGETSKCSVIGDHRSGLLTDENKVRTSLRCHAPNTRGHYLRHTSLNTAILTRELL